MTTVAPAPPLSVRRDRLITRLHQLVHRRLVLVVAPAGYGKTTLLRDFAADCDAAGAALTVCWYSAAPWDTDAALLLERLVAAVRTRFPDFGERTRRMLASARGGASPAEADRLLTAATGTLVGEFQEHVRDYTLLVVDDYHLLDESAAARTVLEVLLERLPAHIHVALVSRTTPALDTGRLIYQAEVGTLNTREIAFTADELALFLRQRYAIEPAAALVEEVRQWTEGWVAGLILAAPAGEGTPSSRADALVAALAAARGGSAGLHEYLVDQLFRRQTAADQDLLLAAALPELFRAADLDEVLERTDSAAALARLERAGVPLLRVSAIGAEYRMHALLKQHLRAHLASTARHRHEALHQRWAALAETRDDVAGAMEHYLNGRLFDHAAQLIEHAGEHWIDLGRRTTVDSWIARLPGALMQRRPRLALCAARLALSQGDSALAVERARQAGFTARRVRDATAGARSLLLEAVASVVSGRPDEGITLCTQALALPEVQRSTPLLAETHRSLGLAFGLKGSLERSVEHLRSALARYEELGQSWDTAAILNNLGTSCGQLGHAEESLRCHERALALRRAAGDESGIGRSLNNIGVLLTHRGACVEAEAAFQEAIQLAGRLGDGRLHITAHVNLGELRRVQRLPLEAMACYEPACEAAAAAVDPRWHTFALVGKAGVLLSLGDGAAAADYARRAADFADEHGLVEARGHATVMQAAAALSRGSRREAGALLHAARTIAQQTGSRPLQVKAYLWSARAAYDVKRWGETLAAMHLAAGAAAALGGPGAIAMEGCSLVPLLRFCTSKGEATGLLTRALDLLDRDAAHEVRETLAVAAPPAALPVVELRLLGPFACVIDGREVEAGLPLRSRVRELLAYLALHPEGCRREALTADLWPDAGPGQDVTLAHTTVHRLRQALFPEVVPAEGPAASLYRLNPAVTVDVDVRRFEDCTRRAGRRDLPRSERRALLVQALDAYGGPFFAECYADWAEEVRQQLERRYLTVLSQLADVDWNDEHYRSCLEWCRRLLEVDGTEEAVHYRMMECYERLGEPLTGLLHLKQYFGSPAAPPVEGPSRAASLLSPREGPPPAARLSIGRRESEPAAQLSPQLVTMRQRLQAKLNSAS